MEKIQEKAKEWFNKPVFPFLFTALFVLILYVQNLSELYSAAVLRPLIVSIVIVGALFIDINRFTKNRHKAGLIVSALAFAFFLFRPLRTVALPYLVEFELTSKQADLAMVTLLSLLVLLIIVYAIRSDRITTEKTRMFNTIAVVLLLFNGLTFMRHVLALPNQSLESSTETVQLDQASQKRDVYYLVFDRYANNDTLQREMNFANNQFLSGLKERGFSVKDAAYSNYQSTSHSLASSLSMRYLDREAEEYGTESNTLLPLISLMRNSKVAHTYQQNGYTYLHAGSWWGPTRFSDISDEKLTPITMTFMGLDFELTEFERLILNNSLASSFVDNGVSLGSFDVLQLQTDTKDQQDDIFHKQMDYIVDASKREEPTFTFLHALMPHPPYVFLADGTVVDIQDRPREEQYVDQLQYANSQIERAVDAILTNSETEPVIIIQADEGPYPENAQDINWHETNAENIKTKTGILQALYLPEVDSEQAEVITQLSPVNLHRAVMNQYFKTDYELLPDYTYMFSEPCCKYDFKEVTGSLKSK